MRHGHGSILGDVLLVYCNLLKLLLIYYLSCVFVVCGTVVLSLVISKFDGRFDLICFDSV